jgi:hypothetical protein
MQELNRWLNNQPYNITMRVTISPDIENFTQFYHEQSDRATRRSVKASVEIDNEIARQDFLEQDIQNMLTYPDAERIINSIKGESHD